MVFNNWINIYKSLDFGFIDKTGNKYIFINSSSKGWMKQFSGLLTMATHVSVIFVYGCILYVLYNS